MSIRLPARFLFSKPFNKQCFLVIHTVCAFLLGECAESLMLSKLMPYIFKIISMASYQLLNMVPITSKKYFTVFTNNIY